MSNNHTCLGKDGKPHPFYDICDELKGKYPKDFKFTGWHAHCRCIATTILKTEAEMDADDEAILRGDEPADPDTSENAVTELPDNFRGWMEANQDRIARARSLPYFIRDNDKLINPTEPTPKVDVFAALDKAVVAGHLPKVSVDKLREIAASGDTELFERRATSLQAVAERHAARTPKQAEAIRQRWEQRLDLHQYTAEQVANFTAIEKDLGVKRGSSMSHIEANQDRPNPNYNVSKAYRINCQSCVLTYELRRRGFDLETLPFSSRIQDNLSHNTNLLWFDPKTGGQPRPKIAGGAIEFKRNGAIKPKSKKRIADDFEVMTDDQGRYHMTVTWKGGKSGHIVTCERLADGTMRIYDPQTGKLHTLQYYLDNIQTARGISIVRVDNLQMVPTLQNVMKKSGTATPRIAKQGASGSGVAGARPFADADNSRQVFRQQQKEVRQTLQQAGSVSHQSQTLYTGRLYMGKDSRGALMTHAFDTDELNAIEQLPTIIPNLKDGRRIELDPANHLYQEKIRKGWQYMVCYEVEVGGITYELKCAAIQKAVNLNVYEMPYSLKKKM